MSGPRTYIVRIYRQGYRSLMGTVEDSATTGTRAFQDLAELGGHLLGPIPPAAPDDVDEATIPPTDGG